MKWVHGSGVLSTLALKQRITYQDSRVGRKLLYAPRANAAWRQRRTHGNELPCYPVKTRSIGLNSRRQPDWEPHSMGFCVNSPVLNHRAVAEATMLRLPWVRSPCGTCWLRTMFRLTNHFCEPTGTPRRACPTETHPLNIRMSQNQAFNGKHKLFCWYTCPTPNPFKDITPSTPKLEAATRRECHSYKVGQHVRGGRGEFR